MNLLFLDSIEKETYGGMEEWIRLVASGLVGKGHRVRVVGRPSSRFLDRLERETEHVQLTPLEISGDFHPGTIASLKSLLAEDNTDIIVTNFNKDLRLGGLAAKLEGNVRVIWSVGLDITKDNWLHRILTPRLFDGVLVPSQSLKEQITRHGYIDKSLVEVIPIGISDIPVQQNETKRAEARASFELEKDAIVAVTVGRFVEQKGHRYLIEVLAQIKDQSPKLRLLWCGDGPLKDELEQLAEQHKVRERIVFAGMLNDVTTALDCADLMIHPSIEEPFGIAVLEGMRAGLPVIASKVGGIPEVLGDAGILVEPHDPTSLAAAIQGLVADRSNWKKLGEAARSRFEQHFSSDAMISRIEQYCLSMLQTEKRHG